MKYIQLNLGLFSSFTKKSEKSPIHQIKNNKRPMSLYKLFNLVFFFLMKPSEWFQAELETKRELVERVHFRGSFQKDTLKGILAMVIATRISLDITTWWQDLATVI